MHANIVNIADHGARGDGCTLNTAAIQAALDLVEHAGGGTVMIPKGVFMTGTLRLPSHLRLHLEAGAVLLASPQLEHYPAQPFHHEEWGPTTSLLFALERDDIHFEGTGTIDLNDDAFMDRTSAKTGDHFTAEKLASLNPEQFAQTTCVAGERPVQPIFFHGCRNLSFRNLTIRRSPCWALTLSACEQVTLEGVQIRNHLRTPNADGVHLCGCRDVVITGCDFICGDDCVALTGITNWSRPCEQVVITNCSFQSSSAAIRLGHLQSKVRDVTLADLQIKDSNRGMAFFAGDGGWIERVTASRVRLQTRLKAGHWWGAGEPLVLCAAEAPEAYIRHLRFESIEATSEQGIVAIGSRGNITDVVIKGWRQEICHGQNRPLLGQILDLRPARVREAPPLPAIPWLLTDEVGTLSIQDAIVRSPVNLQPAARITASPGVDCLDVRIHRGQQ